MSGEIPSDCPHHEPRQRRRAIKLYGGELSRCTRILTGDRVQRTIFTAPVRSLSSAESTESALGHHSLHHAETVVQLLELEVKVPHTPGM